jgi:type I restriction enzyme M protein
VSVDFGNQTKGLIDGLKATCASYGLGNDGNESKIITQIFLYKFMNDKFGYELKKLDQRFANSWEKAVSELDTGDFGRITAKLSPNTARLKKEHLLSYLFNQQNSPNFSKLFDSTLIDISETNSKIFSVSTATSSRIVLFDELSQFVSDPSRRNDFCKALVNQLVNFSFQEIFSQKFDFFSTIFEYLIKDYNKDGGGKYAEYYTPHAVSKIMAKILVDKPTQNVTCYDPSAGSGTLLMNLAHEIGEENCTLYSQDISQKSSGMLRLNLILNDLVHSISNIVQGNTILTPFHKNENGLRKFDFIVSNPPFKLDFSDFRDQLETKENSERFFAGIPKEPPKKKESMAIYLLFIQHIVFSLSDKGKASIVVPSGFLTAQGIPLKIRKFLVDQGILRGVVSMPSNIFATTGTSVSVLFLDKSSTSKNFILIDASKLGTTVKEGKNQKTVLSEIEENKIITTFQENEVVQDFSVFPSTSDLEGRSYSLSAGQYFDIVVDYAQTTPEDFKAYLLEATLNLGALLTESNSANSKLTKSLSSLSFQGKKFGGKQKL